MQKKQHKILIFIVAYNAEQTIASILDRLPAKLLTDPTMQIQVLIIDDCSVDATVKESLSYQSSNTSVPLIVLSNPVNLGYGGNQKLGYRYAIDNEFDFVVLLHGDGQYAPEEVPKLLNPLISGEADAVFGSRMMNSGDALRGGMPKYKYLGNIVLTKIENFLVGTNLSEYHSGYRLYSVDALKKIPFIRNSNDFDFDTDIIIQLHNIGAKIQELPIPTFYGNEICHVNGLQYAFKIIKSCLENKMQRFGLLYNPKFNFENENHYYLSKFHFSSSHSMALNSVSDGDRVLILGSGPYSLVKPFHEKGCKIIVMDRFIDSELRSIAEESIVCEIDNLDLSQIGSKEKFDIILALDIIEHLKEPELLFDKIRDDERFCNSKLVITTPNIAFFIIRIMLALGSFNYGKRGILDRTHTRLFTFGSLRAILNQAGCKVDKLTGIPAPFPLALGDSWFSRILLKLNLILIVLVRSLFSFQIFCIAKISPTTRVLLRMAEKNASTLKSS